MGEAGDALFRRFAEADAWVEHDLVLRDAGARGNFQRTVEEGDHVGDDIDTSVGAVTVMHDDHRHATFGDQR